MAIAEDLTTLKTNEQGLVANKVARFGYTESAYINNQFAGQTDYDFDRDMNVPTGTASVMKVNQTVIDKGWRAQASSLTRMLMNHFLGRLSYNVNKIHDNFLAFITSMRESLGSANGIATLDSTGRLPASQLPLDSIEYKGTWNAETNTPTLADGTGTLGDMYIVSVAGTQDLGSGDISFLVDDRVLYNGSVWQKISGGAVKTVNNIHPDSATGNVEVKADDIETDNLTVLLKSYSGEETWTQGTVATTDTFRTVYYAEGIWVAGGTSGSWWSTDGKTWTQGTGATTSSFATVYYAEGIWVAGSYSNGLWWSTDGKAWAQGTGVTTPNTGFITVYYAEGIWVAGSTSGLWWSTDGKAWTQGTGATTYDFEAVYYAEGIWVAGSYSYGLWWSTNGKSWTQGTGATTYIFHTVYYTEGIWVAGSSNHGLWWSTDGKTWTQGTGATTYTFNTVYYAEGIWVAGTNHGIWWSTDGKAWTQVTVATTYSFLSVYYAEGIWVAGSYGNGLWWSTDGKAWTQGTGATTYSFNAVYYAEGTWVAGSSLHGFWYVEGIATKNVEKILSFLTNASNVVLAAHPKGTLYWTSDANFDPNTEWGGTWVRIKDAFIYAMGDNDTLNATGGAKTVTLTSANLPTHTHSFTPSGKIASTSGGTNNKTADDGQHLHQLLVYSGDKASISNVYGGSLVASNKESGDSHAYYDRPTYGGTSANSYIKSGGTHSHTAYFTGTAGTTGDGGFANTAVDKMPPYICKYCWERTA